MSRIFYDHLVTLTKIDKLIKDSSMSVEEKEELWKVVDEIVHHRVMGCVLDKLPKEHHDEFLEKFTEAPFNSELMVFLESKGATKIKEEIKKEIQKLESEILQEIK